MSPKKLLAKFKKPNIHKYKFHIGAFLGLTIAYLIWGVNFVVVKLTLNEVPIMTMAFIRFFLASLLLLPFCLHDLRTNRIKVKHLPRLFLIGLLTVTFHIYLFYEGLSHTSAIDASVLSLVTPILSVIIGWSVAKEKIFSINILGTALGLIGALVIVGIPLVFTSGFDLNIFSGNFLIILSSLVFVAGAILSKKMLKIYSPLTLVFCSFVIGAITFLVPAGIDYLNNPGWVVKITVIGILGILYITLLSTICAFLLFEWAFNKVGLIKATLFQYIQPAISASLAVPLLGERVSYSFIIGTCLIILGVYWGTLGKEEHHHHYFKHHHK